jgi:pimeloyl-ACP methyl ester carboxylesterase
MSDEQPPADHRFFAAPDGLVLHMRDYRPRCIAPTSLPVVCLPGLSRTADDFDRLARALGHQNAVRPRRVVALDYRGRGRSARDPDPRNYDIFVENADILAVLTAAGIERAVFVGTSRGGLHVFVLAATRPGLIHAAVLNDIGPVIETSGLARIRAYMATLTLPTSWEEAIAIMKRIAGGGFSMLSDEDWNALVQLTYEESNGRLTTRFDPALSKSLEALDLDSPLPILWPQFDALHHVPLLAIRGSNSDLLSPATHAEMATRHPDCETYTVEGQGHAPLLLDAPSIRRIQAFVDRVDPP